jgi:hypothetical protein
MCSYSLPTGSQNKELWWICIFHLWIWEAEEYWLLTLHSTDRSSWWLVALYHSCLTCHTVVQRCVYWPHSVCMCCLSHAWFWALLHKCYSLGPIFFWYLSGGRRCGCTKENIQIFQNYNMHIVSTIKEGDKEQVLLQSKWAALSYM